MECCYTRHMLYVSIFLLLQPLLDILHSTKHKSFFLVRKQKKNQPHKEKGKNNQNIRQN